MCISSDSGILVMQVRDFAMSCALLWVVVEVVVYKYNRCIFDVPISKDKSKFE